MSVRHRIEQVFSILGYVSNVIGTTIILAIVGHFLIGAAVDVNQRWEDKRSTLPVYDDYPDSAGFWEEYPKTWSTHFEPYYHWRRDGFQGKYINVSDEGVRHSLTIKHFNNAKKIFMFGGSTLWGTGSKDEHTIPSFLQSFLGTHYKIYNYGETGYVSTQEMNYLLYQLANGNIPDVVIFYDGVNDGYAGVYSPAIPRDVENLRMRYKGNELTRLFDTSNYKRLINYFAKIMSVTKWDDEISSRIRVNSASVIEQYEAHIKQVNALGKEYGFKTFFFWQPNLFSGTRDALSYEKAIVQSASAVFVESQRQVYLDAKRAFMNRQSERIYFLGDIFNHVKVPIYIDYCHIGPKGNELVARWMLDCISDLL